MEERCEVLWVTQCGIFPQSRKKVKGEQVSYYTQHRFSLRYFTETTKTIVDGSEVIAPGGSYLCIPPEVKFSANRVYPKGFEYFDITFVPHDPALEARTRKVYPPRQAGEAEKAMLNYIVENWHRQDAEIRSNCNSFLTSLLLLLFAEQIRPEAMGSQFILTDGFSRATLSALDYIERRYLSRFSLEELARSTGYNKNYLCMSFAKNTGVSIVTYTNFLRIRKAIGAILYHPKPLSLISESLAFDNPNYFGRTFKVFTGISPREFNKAARQMTPEEKADLYANEPLLKYRRCPLEDALSSMRHIGELSKARAQEAK